MAETTGISWTDSTFNPWIGCTKVSPGCDHCYAAESTPVRTMKIEWGRGNPRHRTSEHLWKEPLRWNEQAKVRRIPWRVFCASVADVFDNEVDSAWRADLWRLIDSCTALTWQLVTKRVGNVRRMVLKVRHPVADRSPNPRQWRVT